MLLTLAITGVILVLFCCLVAVLSRINGDCDMQVAEPATADITTVDAEGDLERARRDAVTASR
jgi:hypothetical protein